MIGSHLGPQSRFNGASAAILLLLFLKEVLRRLSIAAMEMKR